MHVLPLTAKEVEERLLKLDTIHANAVLFEAGVEAIPDDDAQIKLIRVDVDYTIKSGAEIKFRSPVDCSEVIGLVVHYPNENKEVVSQEFDFADAKGNNVGEIADLFAENVVVKVILDVDTSMAFVQTAATNAYLEEKLSKIADDVAYVDDIEIGDSIIAPQNVDTLGGIPAEDYATKNFVTNNMEVFAAEESISASGEIINADTLQGFTADAFRKSDWLPTIAEIGAAPAGFGFGEDLQTRSNNTQAAWGENYAEFCAKIDAELATMGNQTAKLVLARGIIGEKDPTNPYYKALNCLAILFRKHSFDEAHLVTLAHGAALPGTEWRMQKTGGVWQPLEYVNPLIEPGIEYRTTERWSGHAVYCKRIDIGALPNTSQSEIAHGLSATYIVRCEGVNSFGTALPFAYMSNRIDIGCDKANIYVTTTADYSYATAYITIYYTKT